jgi:hypothetical protein
VYEQLVELPQPPWTQRKSKVPQLLGGVHKGDNGINLRGVMSVWWDRRPESCLHLHTPFAQSLRVAILLGSLGYGSRHFGQATVL